LIALVCERRNLQAALKRARNDEGSPGIDGMTVEDLPAHLRVHWPAIREDLLAGRHQPQPVKRVRIPPARAGDAPRPS
jgi:RNA-directed DNA polymerase